MNGTVNNAAKAKDPGATNQPATMNRSPQAGNVGNVGNTLVNGVLGAINNVGLSTGDNREGQHVVLTTYNLGGNANGIVASDGNTIFGPQLD